MPRRFAIKNFGCRATQSDGAAIAADLAGRGLLAGTSSESEVVVVNTCTVTAEADRDARQEIRRIHRENPAAEILVTGCYAQRRPEDLQAIPGVKWVVGNSHKPAIGDIVAPTLVNIVGLDRPGGFAYHGEVADGGMLVGEIREQRELTAAPIFDAGDRSRPNVKVQDGCDNRCTFCIIPSVRGRSRSAKVEAVIEQIKALEGRYSEIVLTGINLGRWGRDLPGRPRFVSLVRRIVGETEVRKIRISSVEPMDWSGDLLELVAAEPRIAKHVHIPLQSASDSVLKRMRRRYRSRHYADRIRLARKLMPTAAIGADVMVGFPGESEAEFEQTRAFIAEMPFTYLHVFTYSAREETEAASHAGQVEKAIKKARNRVLRELIADKNQLFRESLIGRELSAVALAGGGRTGHGESGRVLTDNFVHVETTGCEPAPGELVRVRVDSVDSESTSGYIARL